MNHAGYRDIGEFVARRNIIFHCFGYFSRYIVRALVGDGRRVGRVGGEEFTVALPDSALDVAAGFAHAHARADRALYAIKRAGRNRVVSARDDA